MKPGWHGLRLPRVACALLAVVLLSGCMRMSVGVDIGTDQQVGLSATVEVERVSLEAFGERADSETVCRQIQGLPSWARTQAYERNANVGCRIEGRGPLPIRDAAGLTVAREGEEYVFGLRAGDRFGNPKADQAPVLAIDQLSVAVTFPGRVIRHSGSSTVNGHTVTWTQPEELFSAEGISARGGANPDPMRWLPATAAALFGLALVGFGVVLVIRGRGRHRRSEALVEPIDDPWAAWNQTSRWDDRDRWRPRR